MRIYIDASAAAKLFRTEAESAALAGFLNTLTDRLAIVSSMLLETELRRIAVREGVSQGVVSEVLRGIGLIEFERSQFQAAGLLPGVSLRNLDALHLVVAMTSQADALVAYDQRLVSAAEKMGIEALSPA